MSDIFSIISCIGVVIYFLSKHSEALAKLNNRQKISVFISYIMTATIAGFSIYYGGAFLSGYVQNGFLLLMIRITVVFLILYLAIHLLNRLLQKITNGIFPKIT